MNDNTLAARPAFYRREGEAFVPTGLGVSPWNGKSQLGMAMAGLCGQVLDGVPTAQPMMTTRISVDILGTVPMERLVPAIRILREGRRMQVVDVEFACGGRVWLRATAVRGRIEPGPAESPPPTQRFWADADRGEVMGWFEERHIDLDRTRIGPGAIWVRYTADVVEGEPTLPLAMTAMLGDFGHGTAPVRPLREWSLANLDITVYASRQPRGEWMLIDADSETSGNGLGYSRTRIGDRDGMFATALQSVFIDRRVRPPIKT